MARRILVPLYFLFVIASSLWAQKPPTHLCIVETKRHPEIQYDPPSGPLALAMYKQLAGKELADGTVIKITVLPASVEKDIMPELGRLPCSWVLQLWRAIGDPLSYQSPVVRNDDVYFSLWNGGTRKAIAKGSSLFPSARNPLNRSPKGVNSAAAELAGKILSQLNKHH